MALGMMLGSRAVVGNHRPTDVAAWTLVRGGETLVWRDVGLEADDAIAPWALLALHDDERYADLLYSELALLHLRP